MDEIILNLKVEIDRIKTIVSNDPEAHITDFTIDITVEQAEHIIGFVEAIQFLIKNK